MTQVGAFELNDSGRVCDMRREEAKNGELESYAAKCVARTCTADQHAHTSGCFYAPQPITGVIFEDAAKWLRDEWETLHAVNHDSISLMGTTGLYQLLVEGRRSTMTVTDNDEGKRKEVTRDELVDALKKLCELIDGGKLFVGNVKGSSQLTDAGNWDAEVVDAFWQIVYHGEVIYG